ncbi:MmgE/PrpD family protein [Georgenia sp. 10Sc9-8]|uniref:MmgE/PrpD family protein n=1 Tax=Georgenia halotolerans TaxID=3028317 RepID=A0ABT5U0Z9_9MICO|nr:MmgE/PrpD family protein [Georgenia halotolerans]
MHNSLFEVLGHWVAGTDSSRIPVEVVEVAKRAILDCVGVTIAGSRTPIAELLDGYAAHAGEGPCTVITRLGRVHPEAAAFVNGAQGHALDFDDCTGSLGGHPSVAVLPAALAMAEQQRVTGRELLTAYVIGFEVAAKLGRAVNFEHYDRGWHPTATLGVFGAAAAAAKLLRLDARTTATALSIAASTAAGMKANFGTATKPMQAGRAAQNGIFAARLASLGADANTGAFEHEQGFGNLFNGAGRFDGERAVSAIENPWDLLDPGLIIKRYPCCASTHGAADAAVQLHERLPSTSSVEAVHVWTHPRRLRHTDRPSVHTGFEAKFSVQYVVARALHAGHVGLADFSPEALAEPAVASLMSRTHAAPMPEERWGVDHFPAEVEVALTDGNRLQARVERPRGNGPHDALTDDELRRKFDDCCRWGGLAEPMYQQLASIVLRLEDMSSLDGLLAALRPEREELGAPASAPSAATGR